MKGYIYGIYHGLQCLYIGSTSDYNIRKVNHICDSKLYERELYKYINSLENGWRDVEFKLLLEKDYPSKEDRRKEEREFLEKCESKTFNICLPWTNKEETNQKKREYYYSNRDKILQASKEYYEKNKDYVINRSLNYYYKNKDKLKDYRKDYYDKNRDKIKKYQQEYRKKYKQNSI